MWEVSHFQNLPTVSYPVMILEGFNVKVKGYLQNSDYEECSLVNLSVVTSCTLEEGYRHFQWIQPQSCYQHSTI